MWRTVDPEGRLVVLTEERWGHIAWRHRELAHSRVEILTAVAIPDERLRGRAGHEEWFYGLRRHGRGWVKVVVHYEANEGLVVTAFAREMFP